MTNKTIRALQLIRGGQFRAPAEFARAMWPDSDGFKRHYKCGRGSSTGTMMAMAGGGFLGKLRKRGLIHEPVSYHRHVSGTFTLTAEGREALKKAGGRP